MNPTRKSRKKQTKLSFSPAAPTDRHAYVTYEGSPAKKRRIDEYLQSLPTPSDGPSSSAVRQLHTSPPQSSVDPGDSKHRLSNVGGDQSKQDHDEGSSLDSSDSDMSHDSLVLKTPKAKKGSSRSKAVPESSQIFSQPPASKYSTRFRRSNTLSTSRLADARRKNSARSTSSSNKSSDGSDDDVLVAIPRRQHQSDIIPKDKMRNAEIRDEDDDEDDIRPSTQRALRRSQRKTIKPDTDDVIALDDDREDQDGDQIQAPMLQDMDHKSLLSFSHPQSPVQIEEDQDDNEENEAVGEKVEEREEEYDDDDDDDDDIVPVSTQRRRRKAETNRDGVEQDESVALSSSSSRDQKLLDRDRQNEIDEDAEDLKVSTVFREDSASRKPSKHSQRLQRLRQLRDRRGNKSSSPVHIDSDPDSVEELADDALAPLLDEDDDELDDWVVDEEDGEENVIDDDGDADITDLDLMRHRKLKLKEHWDFVIKWMVSNRLNPGGMTELQPFYQLSIDRVNKECQGLIDRLVSSSWVPAFVWSLKARPDYEESPLEAIEGISMDKCGACNRSNHPPSYVVRLLGAAYNSQSLEPLKEESDGEESFDEMGRRLPDEDRSWYLGTSNAMNAHALIHWRKGLKDWVQLYLKKGGFLKSKEIARRDSWSISKRGRLVDEIVEELKASGITKNLWNQFSQKINSAPNVQGQQYWR